MANEIKFMEKNDNADIGVYVSEYNGREYLHIREHYLVARSGERKPTKKGVALSIVKAQELHALLGAVIAEATGTKPTKAAKPARSTKAKAQPKAKAKAATVKASSSPKTV